MARLVVPPRPSFSPRGANLRLPAILLLSLLAALPAAAASQPGARAENGMVSGPERLATEIGVEVLATGGNAIDAAVAVTFALSVTYPQAGALGAGGFLLYRDAEAQHHALDCRETAPANLGPKLFLDEDGRPIPGLTLESGLAVGVPGLVAGLAEAHGRWGSRPWAELIQPAIRLAEDGFSVYPWLAESIELAADRLMPDPGAREIFAPGDRPLRPGDALVQSDLAKTLLRIAENGPSAFYEGPVAEAVVETVRRAGGVMIAEDLAKYRATLRRPIEGSYRGHRVVTFPPPSGGGVTLLQILTTLERYDLASSGPGASLTVHLMAEAERRAFADRSKWLGDPDFVDVPVANLLDPHYLARRGATIRTDRATPSPSIQPGDPLDEGPGNTLHFSATDSAGRAVAFTMTLNQWFGTGIVAEGTGVLLNNEIDDFAIAAGAPNIYGLTGGGHNAVAGGKRPLSSMTPTIVEPPGGGPRPLLVLGSPGGSTIPTSVLQVLINVIDHGMPLQEAVDAPRFHHQWQPDKIRHEQRAFPSDVKVNLIARGHALETSKGPLGNVNAIGLAPDGSWIGAADPRRGGAAAGH
jgi:gamma-glutamyltranspeptidase/glutathione hydrolase